MEMEVTVTMMREREEDREIKRCERGCLLRMNSLELVEHEFTTE